jgi:hypothetical protein
MDSQGSHLDEVYLGELPVLNLTERQMHVFLENRMLFIGGFQSMKNDYPLAYEDFKKEALEDESYELLNNIPSINCNSKA